MSSKVTKTSELQSKNQQICTTSSRHEKVSPDAIVSSSHVLDPNRHLRITLQFQRYGKKLCERSFSNNGPSAWKHNDTNTVHHMTRQATLRSAFNTSTDTQHAIRLHHSVIEVYKSITMIMMSLAR